MKFVSSATLTDRANQLDATQRKISRLERQLKALKDEERGLVDYLYKRHHQESFTFSPVRGRYLKALEFSPRQRKILDQAKARARLLENGLKVPVKTSSWVEAIVRLATEEDNE